MAKLNLGEIVKGAEQLSLGISIVVAIAIGTALGYWLMRETGLVWLLFVGVAIGFAAAILNVKKAYDAQIKSLDELKDEKPKRIKDEDEDE